MADDMLDGIDEGALAIIPNVPLVTVGQWYASTGPFQATVARCLDMVAAQNDPGIVRPRVWAGHRTDEDRTGEPALGIVTDMRYDPTDLTVYGDVLTLRAIADAAPALFPYRSGEFWTPYRSSVTGREYEMVMDGLALLGVEPPAVRSLADLTRLASGDLTVIGYTDPAVADAAAEKVAAAAIDHAEARLVLAAGSWVNDEKGDTVSVRIAAQLEMDAIWSAFYAQHEAEHPWWWVRSVLVDPLAVIVDTDSDLGLVRMSVTTDGDDITFGEAEPVSVQYAPKGSSGDGQVAASSGSAWRVAATFHNAAATRPTDDTTEGNTMDAKAIREAAGLSPDATDEEVLAAVTAAVAPAGDDPAGGDDDGGDDDADKGGDAGKGGDAVDASALTVTVDRARLERLEATAEQGAAAMKRLREGDRDKALASALAEGRIDRASREAWAKALDGDFEGTNALLSALPKGKAAPVDGEVGSGVDPGAGTDGVTHEQIMASAWGIAPRNAAKGA